MFGRKNMELPAEGDALAGREEPVPVPEAHFINGNPLEGPFPEDTETAVFGMGCFWGAERRFWKMSGVYTTSAGYAGGTTPHPTYEEVCSGRTGHAEVVMVVYRPAEVSYDELLRVFWETHDPTQGYRQGNDVGTQYRSAVYTTTPEQERETRALVAELEQADLFGAPIVTEILPLANYWPAEDYHQDYYAHHPNQGYCAFVVGPKVAKFRKQFAALLKPETGT